MLGGLLKWAQFTGPIHPEKPWSGPQLSSQNKVSVLDEHVTIGILAGAIFQLQQEDHFSVQDIPRASMQSGSSYYSNITSMS